MLVQLETNRYHTIRPLFTALDHHLTIAAVIEGTSPGTIYVDDPGQPRAAFIWSHEGYFLAGDVGSTAFNAALNHLIMDTILPAEPDGVLVLFTPPGTWADQLAVVLRGRTPIRGRRLYYEFRRPRVDWRERLPNGITLRRIDRAFLDASGHRNRQSIVAWIESDWFSVDAFLRAGFGFCLVDGDTTASWCLSDCVSGGHCEIGIETDPAYRRRGLATTVVAATVEHALARGLPRIGWHCWTSNLGSRGVAEKVGFEVVVSEVVHYCLSDEAAHMARLQAVDAADTDDSA